METALDALRSHAYDLRYSETEGRYYASTGVSINRVLADIRRALRGNWLDMFTARQLLGHLNLIETLIHLKPQILVELGPERGRAVVTYLQFAIDKGLESVVNGLVLLAWMLKAGCLEIRVALRRHRKTGAALPYGSRVDGYVHEKWAVFTDAEGHRLIAEGSLNESHTALEINAENIGVHGDWWGPQEAVRADLYAGDFETIWENRDPGLYVLDLPLAVRERLIEIAGIVTRPKEIDGSSELPPDVAGPTAREWLQFAILREAPRMPNGRFVGMATAPVAPWPHQAIVARRLITAYPYSFLLWDEVGLGKTIEAGLALRSLILSGLARRVVIAPPASLARQWHDDLASKFFLRFGRAFPGTQVRHLYKHPLEEQLPAKSVFGPAYVIVSTGLVLRKERQQELAGQTWDIALMDEAHYARRSNPTAGLVVQPRYGDLYRALKQTLRPRTRAFWLATAMPMQLDVLDEDPEQDEDDTEVIEQLLRNRSEADLRREWEMLTPMLAGSLYDAAPPSSKTQVLLGYVQQSRAASRPGRVAQTLIFTQFWDTLEDLVGRLRQAESKLPVGTYSGRGGQYTDPQTGKLVGTERDEIKQRFLRGEIDILVCTDAAEGLNLQTADFLVSFDLPGNPANLEQRIGRIDRIGQLHTDIYVQNFCYMGSVEEIVYDRLLNRLGSMISVVGDQQVSLLPVTEEDFRRLGTGEVTEAQLKGEARQRIAVTRQRIRETGLSGREIYEIYQRLAQTHAAERLPATLDGIWTVLTGSASLQALGCCVAANLSGKPREPLLLRGLPGIVDGIASLGPRLRFATKANLFSMPSWP